MSNENERQLTVEELITELQKMPPKAPVCTMGCDCIGDASRVRLVGNDYVMIERL